MTIKKAVFPVAGLGTRFLPATKVIPKEMLPVVDKPIIQYATEEAINAGIKELIFVISETKKSILHHYDDAEILNQELLEKQKHDLLEIVSDIIPADIELKYVEQHRALGLGHAVLCARELVGEEPFAVILPDDMIDDDEHGCLNQMVSIFNEYKTSIVAVENVDPSETDKYGIVSAEPVTENVSRVVDIVEKPDPESAPSTLAVVGRYILTPEILDLLQNLGKGAGGEIQLTDGIKKLLNEQSVHTYQFHGRRFDCGSKLGYIMAKLNYALKHPEVKDGLLEHLQSRDGAK
ncbi:MAG: UTP--glucose-1-phosphate uridylyltransferase GalU [Gammaproteobacteria bacterium]|nr:UTP--glucose-1-phosphate uridylyltransferase GalU [Gammaproteobacteria bacterium]